MSPFTLGERQTHVPTFYRIRIREHLSSYWTHSLGGLALTGEADGSTTLSGHLPDQAALHGVLSTIRDLGVELISVESAADATRTTTAPRTGAPLEKEH